MIKPLSIKEDKCVQLYCWFLWNLNTFLNQTRFSTIPNGSFKCNCNEHSHILYSKGIGLSLARSHSWKCCRCKNSFLPWGQYLRGFKILQRIIGSYFIKEAISCEFETASHCLFPCKNSLCSLCLFVTLPGQYTCKGAIP